MILAAFVISLAINAALFAVAYRWQTDKLTDFSYSFAFIVLVIVGYATSRHNAVATLILVMVLVWALRLGGFLVWRIRRMGRDKRFDGRRGLRAFGSFWLAQAATVPVLLLPALFVFERAPATVGAISTIGLAIWLVGLITETVADVQKSRFASRPSKLKQWIDEGLWHYSRHPNYLGEITIWAGMYVVCVAHLSSMQQLAALLSPVLIVILLRYISGVPLLEKGAEEKWGKNPNYQSYKARTGLILPKF